ncbi:MAG TPA: hypothetical protein VFC19_26035 [Candidatus Limnocylindrales bacterium]|nr:hypothetical protein [Candidatus Limnocylindrales bacterium]
MHERCGDRHESDVLLRRLDGHLAQLRAREEHHQLALAERIAEHLRELIADTMKASAVDRARVRAAVHYFLVRPVHLGLWMVNDIFRDLGRHDLLIPEPALS